MLGFVTFEFATSFAPRRELSVIFYEPGDGMGDAPKYA
jgi:hypothetical protein